MLLLLLPASRPPRRRGSPPTGLLCSALMGGVLPGLIASCGTRFHWYHCEAWSFLKGNGGAVDLQERGWWEESLGGIKEGRLCQGTLYERRIKKNKNKTCSLQFFCVYMYVIWNLNVSMKAHIAEEICSGNVKLEPCPCKGSTLRCWACPHCFVRSLNIGSNLILLPVLSFTVLLPQRSEFQDYWYLCQVKHHVWNMSKILNEIIRYYHWKNCKWIWI